MRIMFLRDYRGRLTAEQFYAAGEVADIPDGEAIVAEGAAQPTEPEPTEPEPADNPTPPRPRGRKA